MDEYRKESARRFGICLRNSLNIKYPHTKITSIFLASQYNLRSTYSDTISNETARKWLNGVSLPSVHRLQVLHEWLDINNEFIARYDDLSESNMKPSSIESDNSNLEELTSALVSSKLFSNKQIDYIRRNIFKFSKKSP